MDLPADVPIYYKCAYCYPGTEHPKEMFIFCLDHYQIFFEQHGNVIKVVLKPRKPLVGE